MSDRTSLPVVGFVGLGTMGQPMAVNLLRNGYSVKGYARSPHRCQPFVAAGGELTAAVQSLSGSVDVLVTMVSDTPDVEEILFGDDGAVTSLRPGSVVVDMSTINPQSARIFADRLRAKDVRMLDAPVSGGEKGAIEGTLSIMVGGDKVCFDEVLPLFDCMGKAITLIGPNGAGQTAKACNQLLIIQIINGVAEALHLAEKSAVSVEAVRQALMGGYASCVALEVHGKKMIAGDYKPGFKSTLHLKDMDIVLKEAERLGLDYRGARLGREKLAELIAAGHSELDSRAVHKLL